MPEKIFVSKFSTEKNWKKAVQDLTSQVQKELAGHRCDLAVFFVSESYSNFDAQSFCDVFGQKLSPTTMIGCNSCGVIGDTSEVEMEPALSMLAMHLPDVKLTSFHISSDDAHAFKDGKDLIHFLDLYPTDQPHFMMLADPMNFDINKLLRVFNDGYKGSPVIGGLASGGVMGTANWLCLDGEIFDEGAVGVALGGPIEFEIVVSQGCRPIRKAFFIPPPRQKIIF